MKKNEFNNHNVTHAFGGVSSKQQEPVKDGPVVKFVTLNQASTLAHCPHQTHTRHTSPFLLTFISHNHTICASQNHQKNIS